MNYIFPKKYIDPITDGFYGLFYKTKAFFKFGKKETDLKNEALMNKNHENNPIISNNIQSNNQKDSGNNKAFDNSVNLDVENNYPKLDNQIKSYEQNLD